MIVEVIVEILLDELREATGDEWLETSLLLQEMGYAWEWVSHLDGTETFLLSDYHVPIEVKWNLPAWMLRDPGPVVDVEDDDVDFQ